MMKPTIVYVHGAHASPTSFAWIKRGLPAHKVVDVAYSCDRSVDRVVDDVTARLTLERGPVVLMGHSLGGVIAASVAQRVPEHVSKVVTMSAPFGGVRVASVLRWVVPAPLFDDIHPRSPLLRRLHAHPIPAPVMAIVTTEGGTPLITEANDGVVAVESQEALPGVNYTRLPLNHFEVLLSQDTVDRIRNFVF